MGKYLLPLALAFALAAPSHASAPLRESFDLQIPAPPTPVEVEGIQRLAYELHFTNFTREPLSPVNVDVLDENDRVLASFTARH